MLLAINGRKHFFNTDKLILTKTGAGRWSVEYDRATFDIIGGRASGGGEREWFVRNEEFFGPDWLPVNSMVAALRLGIQY